MALDATKTSVVIFEWLSTYSWITHQMDIGAPSYIFFCRGPILKPRPVLDFSAQTTRGKVLDFFAKPQNGLDTLVFEKMYFPGVFQGQNRPFEIKSFFSKLEAYWERKSSSLSTFSKKIGHVLNYCRYTRARYHRAHVDQLDFLN